MIGFTIMTQNVKKCEKYKCILFYIITKNRKGKCLHFESRFLKQSRFRPFKHFKMTVWISVLWNIGIQLPKKWPEMVVKWPFIIVFHFWSDVNSHFQNKISDRLAASNAHEWPTKSTAQFQDKIKIQFT